MVAIQFDKKRERLLLHAGPNDSDGHGYDHADGRNPTPPLPPGPSPPASDGDVAPALLLTAQFAGRHPQVMVAAKKVPTRIVFQDGDSRLPLTEVNVSVPLGKTVVIATTV